MKSKLSFNILLIIFVVGTIFALKTQLVDIYEQATGKERGSEFVMNQQPVTYQIGAESIIQPEPLRKFEQFPFTILNKLSGAKSLTTSQIVTLTNTERTKYGLEALSENAKLNASAGAKVDDMIAKNYFEHVSPQGTTLVDLVKDAGYGYIIIGENLALGTFKSTNALVNAWMKSVGHRENILNNKFTEIGTSVKKGIYNGKSVWYAVQHFGLPSSACPSLESNLKQQVISLQNTIKNLGTEIDLLKKAIDEANGKGGATQAQIESYNAKVADHNKMVGEEKDLVAKYNLQVQSFNNCVNS